MNRNNQLVGGCWYVSAGYLGFEANKIRGNCFVQQQLTKGKTRNACMNIFFLCQWLIHENDRISTEEKIFVGTFNVKCIISTTKYASVDTTTLLKKKLSYIM